MFFRTSSDTYTNQNKGSLLCYKSISLSEIWNIVLLFHNIVLLFYFAETDIFLFYNGMQVCSFLLLYYPSPFSKNEFENFRPLYLFYEFCQKCSENNYTKTAISTAWNRKTFFLVPIWISSREIDSARDNQVHRLSWKRLDQARIQGTAGVFVFVLP